MHFYIIGGIALVLLIIHWIKLHKSMKLAHIAGAYIWNNREKILDKPESPETAIAHEAINRFLRHKWTTYKGDKKACLRATIYAITGHITIPEALANIDKKHKKDTQALILFLRADWQRICDEQDAANTDTLQLPLRESELVPRKHKQQ